VLELIELLLGLEINCFCLGKCTLEGLLYLSLVSQLLVLFADVLLHRFYLFIPRFHILHILGPCFLKFISLLSTGFVVLFVATSIFEHLIDDILDLIEMLMAILHMLHTLYLFLLHLTEFPMQFLVVFIHLLDQLSCLFKLILALFCLLS